MTLPWHLTLKADNALAMESVEEVKRLRVTHTHLTERDRFIDSFSIL